jgi:CheY-like chemotaxis protein
VVEDEEQVRTTARRMLESLGYEVTAVGSALEALDVCERREVAIDLVLTDVVMPEMKGTELRKLLEVLRPGLPTVLMSGHAPDAAADASGAAGFLQKPFSTPELAREIQRALG